jgi:hypothetical protein
MQLQNITIKLLQNKFSNLFLHLSLLGSVADLTAWELASLKIKHSGNK